MDLNENLVKEAIVEIDHITKLDSEANDDFSNDDLYNISAYGADLSFREIITMYDESELLKPELQRHYVWDKVEASRFLESILLGLPVPNVFFARTTDSKYLIVDGYQRIKSVYDYVKGNKFSDSEKVFKLTNSIKINERWRGRSFSELLAEDQRRIKSFLIHVIILQQKEPKNDDSGLYQVFERINTGGQSLMPQEIRNCIYQGPINSLLKELNLNKVWRDLYGLRKEDSRMRDREFILRFFALRDKEIQEKKEGQISIKKSLNDFMSRNQGIKPEKLAKLKLDFEKTMSFIQKTMGTNAFCNLGKDGKGYTSKFHPTVFDAISVATSIALEGKNKIQIKSLESKKLELLNQQKFQTYIRIRTTDIENIKGRIGLALKYLFNISHE